MTRFKDGNEELNKYGQKIYERKTFALQYCGLAT